MSERAAGDRPATNRQAVGRVKGLLNGPQGLRRGMNLWPPFLFTGIRVEHVSADLRQVRVRLRHTRLTTNYVGTQFGGSLFAMTDPFWMILVLRALGPSYVVWDQAAEITFLRPARSAITADFHLTDEVLREIRAAAADGEKVLRWFETDLVDAHGAVVARVRKQVYVRRRVSPGR